MTGKFLNIRELITLIFVCFTVLSSESQALLVEGSSRPFTVKQLVSPFAELKDVDSVFAVSSNRVAIRRTAETGFRLFNAKLEEISRSMVDEIGMERNGFIPFRFGEKWGMADTNGTLRIKAKYDAVGPLNEGFIWVKEEGKWGFISESGKWVIKPFLIDSEWEAVNGSAPEFIDERTLLRSWKNGQFQYVAQSGKQVMLDKPRDAWDFTSDQPYLIKICNYRIPPSNGNFIAEEIYDYPSFALNATDSIGIIIKSGLIGYVNYHLSRLVANPQFLNATFFSAGSAAVKTEDGWTMIDSDGKICKHQFFDSLSAGHGGTFVFYTSKNEEIWAGLVRADCEILIPGTYKSINRFYSGCAVCSRQGTGYNYLSTEGDEVFLGSGLDDAEPALNGYAVVKNKDKWEVRNLKDPIAHPLYVSADRNSFRLLPLSR